MSSLPQFTPAPRRPFGATIPSLTAAVLGFGALLLWGVDQPRGMQSSQAAEFRLAPALNVVADLTTAPLLAAGTGTVSGQITLEGAAPALAPLVSKGSTTVKDAAVCGVQGVPNEALVVDPKSNGIANVFVFLPKAPAGYKAKVPAQAVVFDQAGCVFLPHALCVQTGQTVNVLNGDPITHNTHTYPSRNLGFNSAIGASNRTGVPLTYSKPERLPVKVTCDFHPWMAAWHLVLDHPFMAVTDAEGKFSIAGLPAGTHTLSVWQEKSGWVNRELKVTVKADGNTEVNLSVPAKKFATFSGPRPKTVLLSSAE